MTQIPRPPYQPLSLMLPLVNPRLRILRLNKPSPFGVTTKGIRLTICTLTGTSWPDDLVLDLGKSNWLEWSRKLTLLTLQQGFDLWLNDTLPCPDSSIAPEANFI